MKGRIISFGAYLPSKVIYNADLPASLETSDEWIRTRTGILKRHIVEDDEFTSDIAAKAANIALENASMSPLDIDMIIVATTTPDMVFPSTACIVQRKIGANKAVAFDVQAVCSGFVFGLDIASSYISSGKAENILLIGAETMSKIVDWSDRSTCVLFGDGAGAVVIKKDQKQGILSSEIHSDGRFADILYTEYHQGNNFPSSYIKMNGREVYKKAIDKMSSSLISSIEKSGKTMDEIDYIVPHQANIRIIESIAKHLNISSEKVIITVDQHANTSAATIPLAMYEYYVQGKFKEGDLIAMTALGGGMTWGSAVIVL